MQRSIIGLGMAAVILAGPALAGNPPAIEWTRTFSAYSRAQGFWVEQTSDCGFVAAGMTYGSDTAADFFLVKTNASGELEWQRTYGGPRTDQALCARQTSDGGYILAGWGQQPYPGAAPDPQVYVVKTDSIGMLQWQRVYVVDTIEYGYCICETVDGGYALTAINPGSDSGLCIFKLDGAGAVGWQRAYDVGYGHWIDFVPVVQTSDGGFLLGSRTLAKTDATGGLLWKRFYDHVGQAYSVLQTHEGGYVATGPGSAELTPGCSSSVYLLKTDAAGNVQWRQLYQGHGWDAGYSVKQTPDHGFIVASTLEPHLLADRGWIIRTDSLGNGRWSVTLDVPSNARSACVASDGGYVVAGTKEDPVSGREHLGLWKLAPEGE